jgi:hypothetical protein
MESQSQNNELLESVLNELSQKDKANFEKSYKPPSNQPPIPVASDPSEQYPEPPIREYNDEYQKPSNHSSGNVSSNYHNNPNKQYQISPMELLKESMKWALIVSSILFVMTRPSVMSSISNLAPMRFLDNGALNIYGALLYSLFGGFLFFVIYHWIL